ncbi:hypothetical protein [Micromonospora sp. NPDC005652]|uniref:hypothetical protein n=1 Tax=Micromonospora sp. NPDC005652 TaxID=3157046 RepID=UPI0033CBD740
MPYALMPDLDQALVDYLKTNTQLLPLHSGRVGTRLAAGTAPAVRVTSLGGTQPWPWEASQEYQVEWWGGTDLQAKTLARVGESALWSLRGQVLGGRITGVAMPLTQLWSPDEAANRPRFISQVQFLVHPEES